MEDIIRKSVKKILFEILYEKGQLFEIDIKFVKPENYEFHDLEKEQQYTFYAANGLGYHLSFKKSFINIKDENIVKIYEDTKNEHNVINPTYGYEFIMINFFFNGANPKLDTAFTDTTKSTAKTPEEQKGGLFSIGNILWLFFDYIKKHPEENFFAFAADDKRMKLYSNLFDELSTYFYIFPKKRYDKSYKHDQILLIKK